MLTVNKPVLFARTALALSLSLCFLVSGCASLRTVNEKIDLTAGETKTALSDLDKMKRSGAISRFHAAKLSGNEIQVNNIARLPDNFDEPFSYLAINEKFSTQLSEISRRTDVKIVVQPAVKELIDKDDKATPLEWRGTLRGLLDYIAANRDIYWRYDQGAVIFYKTDSRTFNVHLPSGKRQVSSNIALQGISGGKGSSGGSGTVSVSGSATIDAYDAITKSVNLMVSDGGGDASKSVIANPTLGTITVSATPAVLDKVGAYIQTLNERFAQNVLINVRVLNLTANKTITAGAQADLLYQSLTRQVSATLKTPSLYQPATTSPGQLIISGSDGRTSGQNIIEALEEIGKVSVVTQGQVVAANGQPSPFQAVNDITYISGSTTSQAANVGQTTTVSTDTLSVGFTANFLPLILGDNRIMLEYELNISSLLSLTQVGTASAAIQTPNISKQTLQQQAYLRDGESIVLFGYEQERANQSLRRFFPGIAKTAGSDRTVMVIILEVWGGK